jgi:site-specific DNA-methyltransferase (adenine-specific)
MNWKNKLYLGNNLNILRDHVADAIEGLTCLGPIFNSNANYNVVFKHTSRERFAAQLLVRCSWRS